MRIDRPDPAVTALQLMARAPAPPPAVSQASMSLEAGLDAERQFRDSASNNLKARLDRLERLKEVTGSAGSFLGLIMRLAQEDPEGGSSSSMASTAAQALTEMLQDANGDGPPIFPPLPSPLARSRKTLAGYLQQVPDQVRPAPKTQEAEAIQEAAQLLLGEKGVIALLRSAADKDESDDRFPEMPALSYQAQEVFRKTDRALQELAARISTSSALDPELTA